MYVSTAAGAVTAARRVIVSTAVSTPQALRKRGFFADAAARRVIVSTAVSTPQALRKRGFFAVTAVRLVYVSTTAGADSAVRRVQVSTPAGNAID